MEWTLNSSNQIAKAEHDKRCMIDCRPLRPKLGVRFRDDRSRLKNGRDPTLRPQFKCPRCLRSLRPTHLASLVAITITIISAQAILARSGGSSSSSSSTITSTSTSASSAIGIGIGIGNSRSSRDSSSSDNHNWRQPNAKLQLWRRVLAQTQALPRSAILGPTTVVEYSPAVEHLASRLNSWPDQRKSALYYLDLVSLNQYPSLILPQAAPNGAPCLRVSFAQLLASDKQAEASGFNDLIQQPNAEWLAIAESKLYNSVELNLLHKSNSRPLLNRIESEPKLAQAAGLAVEIANLASRLLIRRHNHPNLIGGIASHSFYRFLLTNGLNRLVPSDEDSQRDPSNVPAVHSAGLVFLNPNDDYRVIWAPLARFVSSVSEASGKPDVELVDLSESLVGAASLAQNRSSIREASNWPYVMHWILADRNDSAEIRQLRKRLADSADSRTAHKLFDDASTASNPKPSDSGEPLFGPTDGRWFSPHFDCSYSGRWLLVFSIPFFSTPDASTEQEQKSIQVK